MNLNEYGEKVYKYRSGHEQIKREATYGYVLDSIEINNGMYMHVRDMEYPEKGFASTTDIFSINAVKKMMIEVFHLTKYLTPSLLFFALIPFKLKIKVINSLLTSFNVVAFRIMSPCILQKQHLTPMAKELYKFCLTFLGEIGIRKDISEQFTEIFINIIHFDNAYRYRIQDLFNETTIGKLNNPRKEFKRLINILGSREILYYDKGGTMVEAKNAYALSRFKMFGRLISILMWHPKVLKSYRTALKDMDIVKIQPDEADKFWMCVRGGHYYYFGKNDNERRMMINHLKFVIPTKLTV